MRHTALRSKTPLICGPFGVITDQAIIAVAINLAHDANARRDAGTESVRAAMCTVWYGQRVRPQDGHRVLGDDVVAGWEGQCHCPPRLT